YAFDTKILDILESQPLLDFGGDVFPYLLANNYDLYGFVEDYYWLDVGNPQTYLWANWDLLRKYGWPITPNGIEDSNIWTTSIIDTESSVDIQKITCFGDDVRLKNNVQIKELSVIGSNVEIKEDSIIDKSIIWDNVSIGAGCKINSSIICNESSIGNNVVLNNVIIGPNCKISDDKVIFDKSIEMGTEI
ncbi:MAG: NDP-sugar synthase, partial [Candidatus Lokiarchaeota archaeon]|nr:NDP-sugar synthase [Candidatus Lokiarchaeota archaeon]